MSGSLDGSNPELSRLAVLDAERRVRLDLETPSDRRPERVHVIALSGFLFAAIFALRLWIDDPPALIANFYTVPTALLAVAYGLRGGLIGAAISTGLVLLWHFTTEIEVSVLGYGSRAAVVLIVGAMVGYYADRLRGDIARRRDAERELAVHANDLMRSNERLEQAVRRLHALATVARAAGTETDLRRALSRIVAQGRELAGGASLGVWVREGDRLLPVAASPSQSQSPEPPEPSVRIPLRYRDEELGTLAAWSEGGEPVDVDLLQAVAASASSSIVTARSVTAERLRDAIAASEHERSRWAWELHDETLQQLVGLRVLLSAALRSGDPQLIARTVEDAIQEIQLETANLKRLIAELRPAALDELGLEAALSALCDRVGSSSGAEITAAVTLVGEPPMAPELETTVYRVAQEALTNVAKHADAERVSLTAWRRDDLINVEVIDDGCGFDSEQVSNGFGLRGMRERVELGGGRLEIESGPDGTKVLVLLPISPRSLPLSSTSSARPKRLQTTT